MAPKRQTESEKEATALARLLIWIAKNKGVLGVGAVVYALGGGSGTLVSGLKGNTDVKEHFDSAFSRAILRMEMIETKVDRVLVSQKTFAGAFLKLPDGPAAIRKFRREEKEKQLDADPFGLGGVDSKKNIAGVPRQERNK